MLKRLSYTCLLLLLINCTDFEETVILRKELPAFNSIELNSVFDVFLIQDNSYSVKIEADADVANAISLDVENYTLKVGSNRKVKWLSPRLNKIRLFITAPGLNAVTSNETCSIQTLNTLTADEFSIIMLESPKLAEINLDLDCNSFLYWNSYHCGGKLILKGRATKLQLYTFSLMAVDAKALTSDYAIIESYSRGNCEVFVKQQLEYSIHGEGDILLYGSPQEILLKERTSTGELIQL